MFTCNKTTELQTIFEDINDKGQYLYLCLVFILAFTFQNEDHEKLVQLHEFPDICMKSNSHIHTWVVLWVNRYVDIALLHNYFHHGMVCVHVLFSVNDEYVSWKLQL